MPELFAFGVLLWGSSVVCLKANHSRYSGPIRHVLCWGAIDSSPAQGNVEGGNRYRAKNARSGYVIEKTNWISKPQRVVDVAATRQSRPVRKNNR